jgi:hypothetical protein
MGWSDSGGLAGANFHALDEPFPYEIDVLHHLVENDLAAKIANRLMDLDESSAVRVSGKADGFDVRVKQTPLADPVFADSTMPIDPATLHSIRPVHIFVHGAENGVDIAGVEGAIGRGDKVVISLHDVKPWKIEIMSACELRRRQFPIRNSLPVD